MKIITFGRSKELVSIRAVLILMLLAYPVLSNSSEQTPVSSNEPTSLQDRITCDKFYSKKLRSGYKYRFNFSYGNEENNDNLLSKVDVDYVFPQNLSDSNFPEFEWTDEIKRKKNVVAPNTKVLAVVAKDNYGLNYFPTTRYKASKNVQPKDNHFNGLINYRAKIFKSKNNVFDLSKPYYENHCQFIEVTSCGDGIRDDYIESGGKKVYETCDPADPMKTNWGSKGCSKTCDALN